MQYENRIIFFIDILGFKSLIDASIEEKNVFSLIMKAIGVFHHYKHSVEYQKINKSKQITQFSDSVVISFKVEDESELFFTLLEMQHMIIDLLNIGILVRGGIGYGECVHTKKLLFGPALVRAYELESKHAKKPRIIIDKDVVDIAINKGKSDHHSYDMEEEHIMKILWKDDDGFLYINYIDIAGELDSEYDFPIYLSKLFSIIQQGLLNKDSGVRDKYQWLRAQYNFALEKIAEQVHIFEDDPDLFTAYKSLRKII